VRYAAAEKLEFDSNVKDLLRKRAQARLETATNLANMYAQTEVAIQQADRERRQAQIKAEADSVTTKTRADAEYYAAERRAAAAKLLSDVPLAAQLELKRLDVEIVRATGDKTTFLPLGTTISDMAMQPHKGQMFWASSGGRGIGNGVAPNGSS
jgi:regulator of protease activity HflC (stomatin/prohibitin superfamily)